MATTWGWVLTVMIFPALRLATAGIFVGVFQWLVLQGRMTRPWRWMLATSIGWTLGYFVTLFLIPSAPEVLTGVTLGLATGIAQWIILRKELRWTGWWIIFSMMGWVSGLNLLPGFFLTGTMAGSLTGLCLEILLRTPKSKTIATDFS